MSKSTPITVYFGSNIEDVDLLNFIYQHSSDDNSNKIGSASYTLKYLARLGVAAFNAQDKLNKTTHPSSPRPRPKKRDKVSGSKKPEDQAITQEPSTDQVSTPSVISHSKPTTLQPATRKNSTNSDPFNPPLSGSELDEFNKLLKSIKNE